MSMKTLFVVCQHGNEKLPMKVIGRRNLPYLLANKAAMRRGVRYIETDLNRSFPGNKRGSYEERLAAKLINRLRAYGEVVDLHTATCRTPLFAIITRVSLGHIELVRKLGVEKLVYMGESIASGKALIDHVECGVSIECGDERSRRTEKDLEGMIDTFVRGRRMEEELDVYEVYKIMRKTERLKKLPSDVKNFRRTVFGGEEFYPVLARERSYKGILCLMAKRISLEELLMLKSVI